MALPALSFCFIPLFPFLFYLHAQLPSLHPSLPVLHSSLTGLLLVLLGLAETTHLVRAANLRSKKFRSARGEFGEVSPLVSCVDDIRSNQSIIASISAGGGSYPAL